MEELRERIMVYERREKELDQCQILSCWFSPRLCDALQGTGGQRQTM